MQLRTPFGNVRVLRHPLGSEQHLRSLPSESPERGRTFNDVAKLPHIAGPCVRNQNIKRRRRDGERCAGTAQEMLYEKRNIFGTLSQGWHPEDNPRQTMSQIHPKASARDESGDRLIRGRNNAKIAPLVAPCSDRSKSASFNRTK